MFEINFVSFLLSLIGVIAGAFSTYVVMLKIEIWKERKKLEDELYAPLYYELVRIRDDLVSMNVNFSTQEWGGILSEHRVHKIRPVKFWKSLEGFYGLLKTFPALHQISKNEALKKLSDDLSIKNASGDIQLFLNWLAEESIYIGSTWCFNNILSSFDNFHEKTKTKATNGVQLIKESKEKVAELPLVRELESRRIELLNKSNSLIEVLRKKARIPIRDVMSEIMTGTQETH